MPLSTDGHKPYLQAVEEVFGNNIDYAQLVKAYGKGQEEVRYSPSKCMGAKQAVVSGSPEHKHISTSYVERQNLTIQEYA